MSYLPHTPEERAAMLARIGVEQVEDLFEHVPEGLRSGPPPVPAGMSELEVLRLLNGLAARNLDLDHGPSLLAAGGYRHYILRPLAALTGQHEFYTPVSLYQP